MRKASHKGQAPCDPTHTASLEESRSQRQRVNGGGRGLGSECFTGTEGQFGKTGGSGGDAGVGCMAV